MKGGGHISTASETMAWATGPRINGRCEDQRVFGLKAVERDELTALKFLSAADFRAAARLAVTRKIPVDMPGQNVLIVPRCAADQFRGLRFETFPVADPDKVSDRERAALRRRIR